MEVIKLEDQEIKSLKDLQEEQNKLIDSFGTIEYQIQSLELQKEKLVENLEKIKTKEVEVANTLNKKYGDGVINLESGTFSKQ
jgi:stress response protein YsnF